MRNQNSISVSRIIILIIVILNVVVIKEGYTGDGSWYYALFFTLPLLILAIANTRRKKGLV
jgi:uncharacterized membrane protein